MEIEEEWAGAHRWGGVHIEEVRRELVGAGRRSRPASWKIELEETFQQEEKVSEKQEADFQRCKFLALKGKKSNRNM